MTGKQVLPSEANPRELAGLPQEPGGALDQLRAASMTDEGGVAAAFLDTQEEFAVPSHYEPRLTWPRLWRSAAFAFGSAILATALFAIYQRARSVHT